MQGRNSNSKLERGNLGELTNAIRQAFDGVPKPDNITMRVARGLDDRRSESELAELRKEDKEACWQDISDQDIEDHADVLPFLAPDGLRYYLPAFMIWSLRHGMMSDLPILDYTIHACMFCGCSEPHLLNHDQKLAVSKFLAFCESLGDDGLCRDAADVRERFYQVECSQ